MPRALKSDQMEDPGICHSYALGQNPDRTEQGSLSFRRHPSQKAPEHDVQNLQKEGAKHRSRAELQAKRHSLAGNADRRLQLLLTWLNALGPGIRVAPSGFVHKGSQGTTSLEQKGKGFIPYQVVLYPWYCMGAGINPFLLYIDPEPSHTMVGSFLLRLRATLISVIVGCNSPKAHLHCLQTSFRALRGTHWRGTFSPGLATRFGHWFTR